MWQVLGGMNMDFLTAMQRAKDEGCLIRPKGYETGAIQWNKKSKRFITICYAFWDGKLQRDVLGPGSSNHDGWLKADDLFATWETTTLGKMKKEHSHRQMLMANA
ncbi:MAG: hypothetical protein G01um10143_619 [Parcubacteria group bacterium Gr01-1014_3]|nr:MAG: hypothetical protein G01um10143_619 [Parcubacteria group bacterium Gr01-1014_3]